MCVCPSHPNEERGHLSHWSQTPRAKTPIQTARNSGSRAQPPRAAVRHASVVKHDSEKQNERKNVASREDVLTSLGPEVLPRETVTRVSPDADWGTQ
jgi:hypothetical protein